MPHHDLLARHGECPQIYGYGQAQAYQPLDGVPDRRSMSQSFKVAFTASARTVAEASWSTAEVEQHARNEVAGALGEGFEHLWSKILFHSFEMPGSDQTFMIYPRDAETMEIDTSSAQDSLGEVDTGLLPRGEFVLPKRDTAPKSAGDRRPIIESIVSVDGFRRKRSQH